MPVPALPPGLLRFAETMAFATAGGALFDHLKFPAGWMAGSMLFVALAALFGRPIMVPGLIARIFFIALGITVGGVATPETVHGMATWPASIVLLCIGMILMTVTTASYLALAHGWDAETALFAAVPGALSQVAILAVERDADLRAIVIVQTVRVIVLVVGVPTTLLLLGLGGPTRLPAGAFGLFEAPVQFVVLVGGCIAAALACYRAGFAGGFFFGPMLFSALLHGSGYVAAGLPAWLISVAMVGLGAVNGSRFSNTTFATLLGYLRASLGALAISLSAAAIFVVAGALLLRLPTANLVASYAPGSVDAMMILALALHLDPVFVGAHHLARIVLVSLLLPVGSRYGAALAARAQRVARPRAPDATPGAPAKPPGAAREGLDD